MEIKICNRCKAEKPINEFIKNKNTKDGFANICKECKRIEDKNYYENNKDKCLDYAKEWAKRNREKRNKVCKKYRDNNKKKIREKAQNCYYYRGGKEKQQIYQEKNKEKIRNQANKKYEKNKEQISIKSKEYRQNNLEKVRNYDKLRYKKRKKKLLQRQLERRRNNIHCRLRHNLSNRIIKVLKGINKSKGTIELLGCEIEFFKQHIESKFTKGMTWENYGKWHIDHKIPCSKFDLSKEKEQKRCFHFSNLQPLWARENIIKSDKIIEHQINLMI